MSTTVDTGPRCESTIAAIASPPGPAARGVIRISGPRAADIIRACCQAQGVPLEVEQRGVHAGSLDDGRGQQPASVLWMPGPRSFTREDVAELHLPGSPFLLAVALERVLRAGATLALPGEFTRRAFERGRIDLTRAEGVLALVSARSAEERRAATALLLGGLDERLVALRDRLDATRALCEASLDFDEEDTGHIPSAELAGSARSILSALEEAARWEQRRTPHMGQPRIVLAGAPNAGKSALFNRLVESAQAIESAQAGTTRDMLVGSWKVCGVDCDLIDTAGLDEGDLGPADSGAQRSSERELRRADLLLWVVDGTRFANDPDGLARSLQADFEGSPAARLAAQATKLCLVNKCDAGQALAALVSDLNDAAVARASCPAFIDCLALSALTGQGLDLLSASVARALGLVAPADCSSVQQLSVSGLGRELCARHRLALDEARSELSQALAALDDGLPLGLFA